MTVEGKCNSCQKYFDAHWSKYPNPTEAIVNPYCLYCKSPDVMIWTDEDNDKSEMEVYDDEED